MKDLSLRLKFWSISLYELWFSRCKVPENQNCTEWPQTKLERLTVKKVLYIHYILTPDAQILVRFVLWPAVFKIQGYKNWKCTEWSQIELEHLTVKSTLHILNTYPWDPNFGQFCSTISRFRDNYVQGYKKSEMHQMTPNWTWTLNSQKYTIYTKYLPLRPKFWSVSLYK